MLGLGLEIFYHHKGKEAKGRNKIEPEIPCEIPTIGLCYWVTSRTYIMFLEWMDELAVLMDQVLE